MNDQTQGSSLFDPEKFLGEAEVQGAMDTIATPIPLGRYNFQIENLKVKRVTPDDSSKKPFVTLEVDCVAAGDALDQTGKPIKESTGKDKNFARYATFIDLTPQGSWDLSKGMNVGIGKLRAALGQNDPSQPWKLPMIRGQVFSGEVTHRPDKHDPNKVYAEVRNPLPPQ